LCLANEILQNLKSHTPFLAEPAEPKQDLCFQKKKNFIILA